MKNLIVLFTVLTAANAFAFPVAPFNAMERSQLKSLNRLDSLRYNFEGIVKLSNCSGALISFSGQPRVSKAIVMTNGHCIQKPGGYLSPGEVLINKNVARPMKIYDASMNLTKVDATKIIYATMTDTDVAFYELSESYEEIETRTGIRPFLLDTKKPLEMMEIEIISGYWDRGYSCEIDGFVFKIREGAWTFSDSIRYTEGCDTIGGTSGSPIIAKGERRVVAINNTSNQEGQRCTINNPCEVDLDGEITVRKGVRYGQQTYQTYTCLTPDFRIDLQRAGCDLPK